MEQAVGDEFPAIEANAARELVETSGLPVSTLAAIVGVSRARFHKWLKGEGMTTEHWARLRGLTAPLSRLRSILGPSLPSFMRTAGPAGKPVDLLRRGEVDRVMGLALLLHAPAKVESESGNGEVPGVAFGWADVPEPLGWNAEPRNVEDRLDVLDELLQAPDLGSEAPRTEDEAPEEFHIHVIYGA